MCSRPTLLFIIVLKSIYGFSQVVDDFSDGNFTTGFVWSGNAVDFEVDSDHKLHLNAASASAESYLSVSSQFILETTWEFYVEMDFNPSSSNQLFVYLTSDRSDLSGNVNGYLVRIGNTEDEISLYKQEESTLTEIIDGQDDVIDVSSVSVRVKVIRDADGNWELLRDASGGSSFTSEGTIKDTTHSTSSYFGFLCDYTSTRSNRFWMDDIRISKPLEIDSVTVTDNQTITVDFDQWVKRSSAQILGNYELSDESLSSIHLADAVRDESNPSKVMLTSDQLLTSTYQLTIRDVEDSILAATSTELTYDFSYTQLELESVSTLSSTEIQLKFNLPLNENLAETVANYTIDNDIGNPLSAVLDNDLRTVNLELSEELTEGLTFQMMISDLENTLHNSKYSGVWQFNYVIPLLLEHSEVLDEHSVLISFNKKLDSVLAETNTNYVLDRGVGSPMKAVFQGNQTSVLLIFEGAFEDADYSLEINTLEDADGNVIESGTVAYFEYLSLTVLGVTQAEDNTVEVTFNQSLAVESAEIRENYVLSEVGIPSAVSLIGADVVALSWPELYNSQYVLSISNVSNKLLNTTPVLNVDFEIEKATAFRHVVINEFMADPTPPVGLPEAEYIELYNPSEYGINLSGFLLNGEVLGDYQLASGAYVVILDDSDSASFALENSIAVGSFDVLTNTGDFILLTDQFGNIIDSLSYELSWYGDTEISKGGYSLELIDPLQPCSDVQNWAASLEGNGGTPGEVNSVYDDVDDLAPYLQSLNTQEGNVLKLVFSEPIDESTVSLNSFSLEGYSIVSFSMVSWNSFDLQLDRELLSEAWYELEVLEITDCLGNELVHERDTFYHDISPPDLENVFFLSEQIVALVFSEPLEQRAAETESNFVFANLTVDQSVRQDSAIHRVHLHVQESFQLDSTYSITIRNVLDTLGNSIVSQTYPMTFQTRIDTSFVIAPNILALRYMEKPQSSSAMNRVNYILEENGGFPLEVVQDENDSTLLRLAFSDNFNANSEQHLFVSNIKADDDEALLKTPAASFVYDTRSPSIEGLLVKNDSQLVITWNEPVLETSSSISSNYQLEDDEQPIFIERISGATYMLTFGHPFEIEVQKTLYVRGISDLSGNEISSTRRRNFTYDPRPPQIELASYLGGDSVQVLFSEQITSPSSAVLTHYALDGVPPLSSRVLGPDYESVILSFSELKTATSLVLGVEGVSDVAGNTMADTAIILNTSNPIITAILGTNDSSLLVSFSHSMEGSAVDPANYVLEGFHISGVEAQSSHSVLMTIRESFKNEDSLVLTASNLFSENHKPLLQQRYGSIFKTYFSSVRMLDEQTIELSFETEFSLIEPANFSIADNSIALAILDGEDKMKIRLSLSKPLKSNQLTALEWVDLTDRYQRKLPDLYVMLEWDTQTPYIIALTSQYFGQVKVMFNERMDLDRGLASINKYQVLGVGFPSGIEVESDSTVILDFQDELNEGDAYQLVIGSVADLSGNFSAVDTMFFEYHQPVLPVWKEIVMTELMVDPSPSIGLPEVEYVELLNATGQLFNLNGLRFRDSSTEVILPSYDLDSGAYVVLVDQGDGIFFSDLPVVEVQGFPSLGNSGEELVLTTITGTIVDRLTYSNSWYGDTEKDDGGYSLEVINPFSECPGVANWKASTEPLGGTPGVRNAVYSLDADEIAPVVISTSLLDSTTLVIHFSETMDSLSLIQLSITGVEVANVAVLDESIMSVGGTLSTAIAKGVLVEVSVSGARDCSGNQMEDYVFQVGLGDVPAFNELIITEIMADPEPVVGLPNSEYLEVYNRSNRLISLNGLSLSDATSSTDLPSVVILPKEYLLLLPSPALSLFPDISNKVGVNNWPSLNNTGEQLSIDSPYGIVFEVFYSDKWHDPAKRAGGYSLEMKDLTNPCGRGVNWGSALVAIGGTPGEVNSNMESVPDNFGPNLIQAVVLAKDSVQLIFDEFLSHTALDNIFLSFEPSLSVSEVIFGNSSAELLVTLSENLIVNEVHEVNLVGVMDCNGNTIRKNQVRMVLTDEPETLDVVINEVLFNPRSGGVDFVEIYNRSNKFFDLMDWEILRETDQLAPERVNLHYILAPSAYVALSEDTLVLNNQYPSGSGKKLLQTAAFPPFPNEEGTVILRSADGNSLDAFTYKEEYHLSFLERVDGVSLERIDVESPTQDPDNWASAASGVGFATPGYSNSQAYPIATAQAKLEIAPKVFVPGSSNPGYQSFTTINYRLGQAGQFANVVIYNQLGQPVNQLEKGVSLSTSGFFRWDGTSGAGNLVRQGYYVVVFEVYGTSGQKQTLRETVVVAR